MGEIFVRDNEAFLRLYLSPELKEKMTLNVVHLETGELMYFAAAAKVIRPTKVSTMEVIY